jgi:aryl-alcohol dehydrogenase-like predicted oxidoreductase
MGWIMEYRRMGDSGLMVSKIGLGTNNIGFRLDMNQSREVVHAALDAGTTLFDTADVYGPSEERLGELLGGVRNDVIIATKFGMNVRDFGGDNGEDWGRRGSRRYIRRAVESSLRRLKTDWIDLYQFHKPDDGTPILETLDALDDLVREGKVRYIGHSNFTPSLIVHADWTARTSGLTRFVSCQNRYNLMERGIEAEVVPTLTQFGIGLIPHTPLNNGLLSGKYQRGEAPPAGSRIQVTKKEALLSKQAFDLLDRIKAYCDANGVSMLEVAIGGLAAQPAVASVISGASTAEQVRTNVKAGSWVPTASQLAELNKLR